MIQHNIELLQNKIDVAAKRSGRSATDIKLIAVSKRFPESAIQAAYDAGIRTFGENRIQEAVEKAEQFQNHKDLEIHYIGNLQTNKAKYIQNHFSLLHSIDKIELVTALDKRLETTQNVLIQVNITNESQKSGVSVESLDVLIKCVMDSKRLFLKGLMLIPPNYTDKDDTRKVFQSMNTLFKSCQDKYGAGKNYSFDYLSMGMSGDFEVAIEEGANMIRVGSAIFGQRPGY